jgi:large subunit ribosomal protein L17
MDKLFGELRERYLNRAGGYTRVVRTEPRDSYDQAETSILELVDGPKDTRFMMTAKTVARDRLLGRETTPVTQVNIKKVTQFRGESAFEDMVQRFMRLKTEEGSGESLAYAQNSTLGEAESRSAASAESKKTAGLGDQIVPESYKRK